jgi:hypothetical protein
MSAQGVLKCHMQQNDAGADTVGDYLRKLLEAVWTEVEGFSGKRPFGNSSWEWEVYEALVRGGFVSGKFDADNYLGECDEDAAHKLVLEAIRELGK